MALLNARVLFHRQRKDRIDEIRCNLHESIFELVSHVPTFGLDFDSQENQEKANKILALGRTLPHEFPPNYGEWVKDLWLDRAVRLCYSRANEFQIIDNAKL